MDEKTWVTQDKSTWGKGPWTEEFDKYQYTDTVTGLPCLIKRNSSGALCGYVGVTEDHPWFGKHYDEIGNVSVHGGLTYSGLCQVGDEAKTICHVPGPGEPDMVWWLGFDCNHYCEDFAPAMAASLHELSLGWPLPGTCSYKSVWYVRTECASLAWQVTVQTDY